jgi:hypothetical protein
MGNYNLGIREHTIFPETADEDIKDVFGLAVTVVTTSKDKEATKAFLIHLGFPFKKSETPDSRESAELGGPAARDKKGAKSKKA